MTNRKVALWTLAFLFCSGTSFGFAERLSRRSLPALEVIAHGTKTAAPLPPSWLP